MAARFFSTWPAVTKPSLPRSSTACRHKHSAASYSPGSRWRAPAAPDIVLAMHWKADKSTNGAPGLVYSDYSQYGPGCGMHGSLSPFDMHNMCIAAGPDFRKGAQDDLPSGNIDIDRKST